jgi:hypothetical protein
MSTPAKPTITAAQRRQPTCSPQKRHRECGDEDGGREDQGCRLRKRQDAEPDIEGVAPADEEESAHRVEPQVPRPQGCPAADREHDDGDHRRGQQVPHEDDLKRRVLADEPLGQGIIHDDAENAGAHERDC